MSRFPVAARCGLLLALLTAPAVADEILIYKYASTRPWTLYACLRPDAVSAPAAPVVPKNTLSGTYTETQYWVVNQTAGEYTIVTYSASAYKGTVDKTYYYSGEVIPFHRSAPSEDGETMSEVPTISHLPAGRPNLFNTAFQFGQIDGGPEEDGGAYYVTEQGNLTGVSAPYTVAPGLTFQRVATSLKGPYIYSHRTDAVTGDTGALLRSIYLEKNCTHSLTLDAAATKKANTAGPLVPYGGGAAVSSGSLPHGLRVVGLQLEAIGYDFADSPPGA